MTPAPQADRIDSKLDNKQRGHSRTFWTSARQLERAVVSGTRWCLRSSASWWCLLIGLLLRESPSKLASAGGKASGRWFRSPRLASLDYAHP